MLQAEAPGRRLTGYPDLGRLTVAVRAPAHRAHRHRDPTGTLGPQATRRPKAALEKGESLHRTGVRVGVPARRSVTTSRLPRSMAQRFERTGAARSRRRAALLLRARTSGRIRVAGTCRRVVAMRGGCCTTLGELSGSVLRVSSENLQVVCRAPPAACDVAPLSRSGTHLRDRAAPFPRRLCATASAQRSSGSAGEEPRRGDEAVPPPAAR